MKKWQKIVGIVSLAILAIINFVIYGLSDMQTIYIYIYIKDTLLSKESCPILMMPY